MIAAYKNRITGEIRETETDTSGTGYVAPYGVKVDPSILSSDWEPLYTLEEARKILLEMAR